MSTVPRRKALVEPAPTVSAAPRAWTSPTRRNHSPSAWSSSLRSAVTSASRPAESTACSCSDRSAATASRTSASNSLSCPPAWSVPHTLAGTADSPRPPEPFPHRDLQRNFRQLLVTVCDLLPRSLVTRTVMQGTPVHPSTLDDIAAAGRQAAPRGLSSVAARRRTSRCPAAVACAAPTPRRIPDRAQARPRTTCASPGSTRPSSVVNPASAAATAARTVALAPSSAALIATASGPATAVTESKCSFESA